MTDREQYTPGPASGAQVRAPADMFKRFADVRSLYG